MCDWQYKQIELDNRTTVPLKRLCRGCSYMELNASKEATRKWQNYSFLTNKYVF